MKFTHLFAALIVLSAPLQAGPLEDLGSYLKSHVGQTPIRVRISGEFKQAEGRSKKALVSLPIIPVHLTVLDGSDGFHVIWDQAVLSEAPEGSLPEDLWFTLPSLPHASTAWLDPICLHRTVNPARSLQRLLGAAKMEDLREEAWHGQPAHRLMFRFKAPVPERYRYHFRRMRNFPMGTLTVWVAPDGAPLASEVTMQYQLGLGLLYGELGRKTTEKAIYKSVRDRVVSVSQEMEDEAIVERDITRTVLSLKVEEQMPCLPSRTGSCQ